MLSFIKYLVLTIKNAESLTVPIMIVCFTVIYIVSNDELRLGLLVTGFLGGIICYFIYCIANHEN